jgi:hypothetical protein
MSSDVSPVAVLARVHADVALIGCNGVHAEAGVTNINLAEAEVKAAMIVAAARTVVIADGSKIGRVHLGWIADTSAVDVLITDPAAPDAAGFPSNRGDFGCGDRGQDGLSLMRLRLAGAGLWPARFSCSRGRRGPRGPGRPAGPSPAGRCAAPWRPGRRPRTLSGRSKDSGGAAASFARPARRARRGHAASFPASDRS